MKNFLILFIFILGFSNCKPSEESTEKKLMGTWECYEIQDTTTGGKIPSSGSQISYFKDHRYSYIISNSTGKGIWSIKKINDNFFLIENCLSYKMDNGYEGEYSKSADDQWVHIQKYQGNMKVFKNTNEDKKRIKYLDEEKLILQSDDEPWSNVYKKLN